MVRSIGFSKFKAEYTMTVADALIKVTDDITRANFSITRKRKHDYAKWLIATYFSMATLNQIENGVTFQFRKLSDSTQVVINGKNIPIFDTHEANLYRVLFDYFSSEKSETYVFRVKRKNLVKVIAGLNKFFDEKYIKINNGGRVGVFTLRNLRAYAMINDYKISKEAVKKIFGFKTWLFEDIELAKALESVVKTNKGVPLTPSSFL